MFSDPNSQFPHAHAYFLEKHVGIFIAHVRPMEDDAGIFRRQEQAGSERRLWSLESDGQLLRSITVRHVETIVEYYQCIGIGLHFRCRERWAVEIDRVVDCYVGRVGQ
jgi:hypothetical protein